VVSLAPKRVRLLRVPTNILAQRLELMKLDAPIPVRINVFEEKLPRQARRSGTVSTPGLCSYLHRNRHAWLLGYPGPVRDEQGRDEPDSKQANKGQNETVPGGGGGLESAPN
jgi:hypothetical protein